MLHTMRGPNLSLGEWFRILPLDVNICPVSTVHILPHLSFLSTWGVGYVHNPLLYIWRRQMILFTWVYPQLKTLGPLPEWGRYHHLSHSSNDPTSPVGRETEDSVSHRLCRARRFGDQKV